jgi:UDP-N-acetylglucosamine 2-epimerase (non-hydrolysing)
MKVLTVVGARPNFMKVAPIIGAINRHNEKAGRASGGRFEPAADAVRHVLVHTGQHYDASMSGAFFTDLQLPTPDVWLGVGSGSHAAQTAEIMRTFEQVLMIERPDAVVVVGDVNSTMACAVVTAKIAFDAAGSRPLVAHVEAGLRSFDRSMPEEVNRVLTDHVSDLLFVTEASGLRNLRNEGIPDDAVHFVGNTMIDSLLACREKAEASTVLERLGLRTAAHRPDAPGAISDYALLTLHRPSNVDNPEAFLNILDGLNELGTRCPIVFPVHPRTERRIKEFGFALGSNGSGIVLIEPLGYLDFVCVMAHARLVVTDSGGIQEETTCLGVPCVTVRANTERPSTVEHGTNIVAGTTAQQIGAAIRRQLVRPPGGTAPEKWDGHAATRLVDVLVRACADRRAAGETNLPAEVRTA